jgi:hypothetical protein
MVISKQSVVVALILMGTASGAAARTWTVERDGSGDYAVIQDAVNGAAEGDTIMIGPGRFDEGQVYSFPGWTEFVRVMVNKPNLTLIGSGPTTIIGQPQPWDPAQGEHRGVVAGVYYGSPGRLSISKVAFENIWRAIYTEEIDVAVENCNFYLNCYGCAFWRGSKASIRNCEFVDMTRHGTHVVCWSQYRLEITGCTFVLDDIPTGAQSHIALEGVQDGLIENCQFSDGVAGIGLSSGARATIRNCVFDGQNNGAVNASLGSHLNVDDSIFRNQRAAMYSLVLDNVVTISRCLIEDVEDCSFKFGYIGSLTVNNCDLARGREGVVVIEERFDPCTPHVLDMSNNYWGTDNSDSIQAWIFDANDSDRACYLIDYEPFRSESTPVVNATMGGVKSLFRR